MTDEQLNTEVYFALNVELQNMIKDLQRSTPEEVIERAYELVTKEDIVMSLEEYDLTARQCKAILKEKNPLDKIYQTWEKLESKRMDEIRNAINIHADNLLSSKVKDNAFER